MSVCFVYTVPNSQILMAAGQSPLAAALPQEEGAARADGGATDVDMTSGVDEGEEEEKDEDGEEEEEYLAGLYDQVRVVEGFRLRVRTSCAPAVSSAENHTHVMCPIGLALHSLLPGPASHVPRYPAG